MSGLLLALLACSGGSPQTMSGCSGLGEPTEREDCRLRVASNYLDDLTTLRQQIALVPAPESRDLLRIRLAIQDPHRAGALCRDTETAPAAQRCQQVLGRPHLRSPRPGQ